MNQDKDRMEKEKDDKIKELEIKINSMGLAYENVLNVSTLQLSLKSYVTFPNMCSQILHSRF